MPNKFFEKSSAFLMNRLGMQELLESSKLMSAHMAGKGAATLSKLTAGNASLQRNSTVNTLDNTLRNYYTKKKSALFHGLHSNGVSVEIARRASMLSMAGMGFTGYFGAGPDRNLRIGAAGIVGTAGLYGTYKYNNRRRY